MEIITVESIKDLVTGFRVEATDYVTEDVLLFICAYVLKMFPSDSKLSVADLAALFLNGLVVGVMATRKQDGGMNGTETVH